MVFKQSIHYPDAVEQIGSNRSMRMLELYKNKWQIEKTIIHMNPNGMPDVIYIDTYGNYVYERFYCTVEYPVIGELIEVSESICTEEMAEYIKNHKEG